MPLSARRIRAPFLAFTAISGLGIGMLACLPLPSAKAQTYDSKLWSGLSYRMVGPIRGGRVTAVTGVAQQPLTFYMGSTGGGVWKTIDAGHTFVNVSDGFFSVGSIGAVAVAPSDPNIVYVGTGSSKIRSNVSIGKGMYKSTDAGKTWAFIGLPEAGQIATLRVDPKNPDVVWVAAQGNPFKANPERGVYKTVDGGKSWKQVLHVSDTAGAAAIEMQPGHPEVVFACIWHALRTPWTIISGSGEEGGIYKTKDGGEHWTKLAGGLPNGLFGRSNVVISKSSPNRVYAIIEANPGQGFYRSDDGGEKWTLVNHSTEISTRGFYYSTLGVDPNNADDVWLGDETWFKSADAGKTFKHMPIPHGDNHDVWINPSNSNYMIQGDDGGATVSIDGGITWTPQNNQPTAEIYQVYVDNQFPYRLYGAQQDNTTVIVPSFPLGNAQDYREGPGCETGPIIPDTKDPNIVYGGCKGQWSRMNINTHDEERYWIGAESLYGNAGSDLMYRFQRVAPMEVSPNEPHVNYYGSQFLHRSRDGGVTWEKISPDLTAHPPGTQGASGEPITRDATGEEIYSVIYSIRESPLLKGLIWTGSNDGPIYVTKDDGKSWANVTPKGLPPGCRVQNLEPSPHHAATAYASIYCFLNGGNMSPYIYRTDDFGKSWKLLTDGTNGIPADSPTRVVREDPDRAGLLYAGTEFGMYISFDNGDHWQSLQLNLPITPVTDIKVTHKDLQLSTQGRSFYILDDITPLHQIKTATSDAPILFKPRDAIRTVSPGGGGDAISHYPPSPSYPRFGAWLNYYLPTEATQDIKLEILDAKGNHIRTFSSAAPGAPPAGRRGAAAEEQPTSDEEGGGFGRRNVPVRLDKSAGMHRFTWDLRYPGPWVSVANPEGPNGPAAVPGRYLAKLTVGSYTAMQPFTIVEDPRITADGVTTANLQEQFDQNIKVRDLVSEVNKSVSRIRVARTKLTGDKLAKLNEVASHMITPAIRYSKPELQTHITYLFQMTNSTDQKVGRDAFERYTVLKKELAARNAELKLILGDQFAYLGTFAFPGDVSVKAGDDDDDNQ
jgi:photosystem II stability/assembly factor-like uncharacterized protein